ncbi:putative iron transport protein [Halorhabdus tiamatea SARL4B]|uniref:Ferrichrome ABC transporter, substrate-binding protein n=1 Tax=Halorhabdus tiamatea SARL4B TaxID=1033806 RepID=F7PF35_9EURY|nr:ABC transporter substrate-binding protein [Halorhabdus tiamatea]ERJ06023.1 putative iron transport protein [Halorhabdus tiamatea SARL4B]CCQ34415.1 ferrichrome ABC transporter, substrate-binding protein [Halorhabdus tiamatea SARL4B]
MADEQSPTDGDAGLTRRAWLASGTALLGGGLAGCLGGGDGTETPPESTPTATDNAVDPTATATPTETTPTDEAQTQTEPEDGDAAGAYSVSMAPMGEVTFEETPEDIFTIMSPYAEMALALGRGDDVNAVYAVEYTNSLMDAITAPLDGVSVDWRDCFDSWNPSPEKLYDLESEVHLADPAHVTTMGKWEPDDVEEISDRVAPWFGNKFSAEHGQPPEAYAQDYEYYTLWETFGYVAAVLRERERYEALRAEHEALVSTIREGLPPESERPTVTMVLPSTSDDTMWVYDVNGPGYHAAHTRPLGAVDAFADDDGVTSGTQIDYEELLEADPDVLVILGGIVDTHDMPAIREALADDPVAGSVSAVENGRIYAQGGRHQGPLLNLFQLEMGAKQLYPEAFGAWPGYESGPYPDLSADEQLFDHRRVAETITGDR